MALVVWPGLAWWVGCLPFRRRHLRPPKWRNSNRKWQHNCLAKLLPHLASQQAVAHATLATCNYSKRTPLTVLFFFAFYSSCFVLFCVFCFVYVFLFLLATFVIPIRARLGRVIWYWKRAKQLQQQQQQLQRTAVPFGLLWAKVYLVFRIEGN